MPRVSTTLLLMCWVVSAIPAQEIGLRADCGGWKPGPELRARALALKGLDAKQLEAAAKGLEGEGGAALRIRICRAGLRLADEQAALACATRLQWDELDLWETGRVIALCLAGNEYARPGTAVDFEQLRSMIGGRELPLFFAGFPAAPWNDKPTYYLANLHRQCTAKHIPVLSAMLARPEAEIRRNAWENLYLVAVRSDRHLDCALRAMLTWKGISIRTGPERALRPDEWSPALRTLVFEGWPGDRGPIDPVVRRAMLARRPRPEDEAALRSLVERSLAAGADTPLGARRDLLVRALRGFRSPATLTLIRAISATDRHELARQWSPRLIATAALAAAGDTTARAALRSRAARDDEALALWLEAEPRVAAVWYEEALLAGSDAGAERALARWEDLAIARHDLSLDWPDDLFAGLAGRAVASPRSGLALLGIGVTVPGCATEGLARAAIRRLRPGEITAALSRDDGGDQVAGRLALADAAAPDALRVVLRAWANDGNPAVRIPARSLLLVIGDPESGPMLAQWVVSEGVDYLQLQWIGGQGHDYSRCPETLLARSPCPEVRALLRARGTRSLGDVDFTGRDTHPAIVGLAVLDGLPLRTADQVTGGSHADEDLDAVNRRRKMVVQGRTAEALRLMLGSVADFVPDNLWRVDRPEVRRFLERMRREREHRRYLQATAALACLGDPAARRETFAALRAGRYRWLDELADDEAYATLGYDLTTMVPFWIDQLESNCCRNCVAENVLGDLFPHAYGLFNDSVDKSWETRAAIAGRWWRRHREARFVRSRIIRQFIPVLPD